MMLKMMMMIFMMMMAMMIRKMSMPIMMRMKMMLMKIIIENVMTMSMFKRVPKIIVNFSNRALLTIPKLVCFLTLFLDRLCSQYMVWSTIL